MTDDNIEKLIEKHKSNNLLVQETDKVEHLRAAYAQSCKHNGKNPDDHEYFRSYAFHLIVTLDDQIEELQKTVLTLMAVNRMEII